MDGHPHGLGQGNPLLKVIVQVQGALLSSI